MSEWQLELMRIGASAAIALIAAYLGYHFASKVQKEAIELELEAVKQEKEGRRRALRLMLNEEIEMNTGIVDAWWNRPEERNHAEVIKEPLSPFSLSIWNGGGPDLFAALSSDELRSCWILMRDLLEFQAIVTHLAALRAADKFMIQQAGGSRSFASSMSDQFPYQARDVWPRLSELFSRIVGSEPLVEP